MIFFLGIGVGGLFPESNRIQDIIGYVELDCGYNVMFLVGYNYQWLFLVQRLILRLTDISSNDVVGVVRDP